MKIQPLLLAALAIVSFAVACTSTPSTKPATGTPAAKTAPASTSTVRAATPTAAVRASPITTTTATAAPPSTPAPSGESGIEGIVLLGPTCPVQREGDTSCDDRPYEATLTLKQGGRTVARGRSDAQGRFRIAVPPGTYVLAGESPSTLPRGEEQTVTVEAGRFTEVQVHYDSGIR